MTPSEASDADIGGRYRTLGRPGRSELVVKRSRFVGTVAHADDEAAAREAIAAVRGQHPDAGHHCTAFILGPDGQTERSSDDGEPSGTAGAPMLEVLRGHGLTYVVAVVSRWFGGTLLGSGGLVRAYGDAVRDALDAAATVTMAACTRVSFVVDHADAGRAENEVRSRGFAVAEVAHAARVEVTIDVLDERRSELEAVVAQATSGRGRLIDHGRGWTPLNAGPG